MSLFADQVATGSINLREIFRAKNPKLAPYIPGFIYSYLNRIVHIAEVNDTIRRFKGQGGVDFATSVLGMLEVTYQAIGLERIDPTQRYVLVSNHPLGGLDGMVLIAIFGRLFPKVLFPVNDLLTLLPQFADTFVPINKHGRQSSANATRLQEAYDSPAQILYFPAGLCSRKQKGKICDLEWKRSFVGKAIESKRHIVPLFFEGRNSNFFYNLALWRKRLHIKANIEMLYLVDEMFRQRGANLTVHVGEPILHETLAQERKSRQAWARDIREMAYELEPDS